MNLRIFNKPRILLTQSYWKIIGRVILYIFYPYLIFSNILSWSKVASCSMTPTILTHDITIMAKYSIKIIDIINMCTLFFSNLFNPHSYLCQKYPFLLKEIIIFRQIQVGDIIVFTIPGDESAYTKRIIAGPGDKVQMYYGYYFVNGKQLKYEYKGKIETRENNTIIFGDMWSETNLNGKKYNILRTEEMGKESDISDIFIVPKDSYFVSGDNRDNSDDGRSMLGFIHKNHIIYQVVFNLFSNSNLTTLNMYQWIRSIRKEYTLRFV